MQALHRGTHAIVLVVCSVVTASAQGLFTNTNVGPGAFVSSSCPIQDAKLLPNVDVSIPRYWPLPNQAISIADKRCSNGSCSLQGRLYRPPAPPPGDVKFPAVIYVHGHNRSPGEACYMIDYYTSRGYIVFAPVLRGSHDDDNAFSNTGTFIDDYLPSMTASDDIDYLHQEIAEVRAALTYLTTFTVGGVRPVDPTKIALMGHSYGGSLVIFAAAANLNPQPAATVDLSGATLSWGSSSAWKAAYQAEAALHQMPIRFQQTVNESSALVKTDPTTVPFMAANGSGTGEAEMAIYSAVPNVSTISGAHGGFMLLEEQVKRWAPAVLAFIQNNGVF